jgi:hypothetical protein
MYAEDVMFFCNCRTGLLPVPLVSLHSICVSYVLILFFLCASGLYVFSLAQNLSVGDGNLDFWMGPGCYSRQAILQIGSQQRLVYSHATGSPCYLLTLLTRYHPPSGESGRHSPRRKRVRFTFRML